MSMTVSSEPFERAKDGLIVTEAAELAFAV
jgi:hypothetical protein